jgi:hypothetical protein
MGVLLIQLGLRLAVSGVQVLEPPYKAPFLRQIVHEMLLPQVGVPTEYVLIKKFHSAMPQQAKFLLHHDAEDML